MGSTLSRVLTALTARTALTALVGTLVLLGPPSTAAAAPAQPDRPQRDRPNILLITTDDQSVADLQYMPYTRRLLGEAGAEFTDALSPFPLCCPARATLLTGQHAHNHGVLANTPPAGGWEALRPTADTLLPVWLRDAGYRTTFIGKYLNSYGTKDDTEVPPGWDSWNATVHGVYRYYGASVNQDGTVADHTGEYQTDLFHQMTKAAIEESAGDGRPFFIWQSNVAPHGSCWATGDGGCRWGGPMPPKQDRGTFATKPFGPGTAPSFDERVVVDKPRRIRDLPRVDAAERDWLDGWDRARVESLQSVDRNVRDTVALLRSLGELDSTLIVFASDNGFALGEHRWAGKTLGYEPTLRVPLLMRGPGVPAGRTVKDTVSLVDVPATIADAAGVTPLRTQDGTSLFPVAAGLRDGYGTIGIEAGPVFKDVPNDSYSYRGVRTARYTYMVHPATDEVELYDRKVDPDQLVNVAYRPTYAATRRSLQDKLDRLQDCAGRACTQVSGAVPPPAPGLQTVHPDELAASKGARQLVTVTAPRPGAITGTAVAWQRHGRQWRVARGPMAARLGGDGMAAGPGRGTGAVPAGVRKVSLAFGRQEPPTSAVPYRRLDEAGERRGPAQRSRPQPALSFLSETTATWGPQVERLLAEHPDRFERSVMLSRTGMRGEYWSTRLSEWLPGVPASVRARSLLLHTGSRFDDRGWVAMRARDLGFLLDWAGPDKSGTKVVVGTPTYLRDRL